MNSPKPNEDGRYEWVAEFPNAGVPDMRIWAKTANEAKYTLKWYLYNECNDDITADD